MLVLVLRCSPPSRPRSSARALAWFEAIWRCVPGLALSGRGGHPERWDADAT